jgi:hypothetical protein
MDMSIVHLFTQNPLVCIIAVVFIIFIIGAVVRAAVKLAGIALIIGVILVLFFGLTPNQAINKERQALSTAVSYYNQSIKPVAENEIKDAKVTQNSDGTFVIQTKDFQIDGKKGSDIVTVVFKGKDYKLNADQLGPAIQSEVQKLEKN